MKKAITAPQLTVQGEPYVREILEKALTFDEVISRIKCGEFISWVTVHDGNETYEVAIPSGAVI
jgi:hypothetical protein